MRTILTTVLLFSVFFIFAQCDLAKNEVDAFTGEKVVETKLTPIFSKFLTAEYFSLALNKSGDIYKVITRYQSTGIVDKSQITESDQLLLKLNGTGGIITLQSNQDYPSTIESGFDVVVKSILSYYTISKSDFQKLQQYSLEKIRYTYDSGAKSFDFDVKPKNAKQLQADARCIQ